MRRPGQLHDEEEQSVATSQAARGAVAGATKVGISMSVAEHLCADILDGHSGVFAPVCSA